MPRKFLVVVDDTPELDAALAYAARRARSTGGHVVLLRALVGGSDEHWSGVRDEIRRQQREEAEALLARLGEKVAETSGAPPVYLIEEGDPQAAIRKAVSDDPDIKILILAAGANGRGPGPLISAVLKHGAGFTGRKLPVTIVPGELTEEEIQDLA
ncbi:universal stress protein [Brevundimonas sp. 3P9-tot-E]|uniref:universal stress protein n=1 Tax=Brevundimonas TaxID=41275 RepID=UPI000F7AF888|nr:MULTISPECIES: universal stress protein [Brevundimonas]MDA1323059.1 universal stress protein [Pseudomonadota bacterium]MBK1969217.1 universal stress protein [Brevundimonas diminuta]MBK1975983.1 universal stress protein [Brevundimonas diminuta]MDM8352616.1 universal stress protein [Brevundimonas diminuta]RSB46022.1 universal stress protein [Brevundimonas sp. 357]